MVFTSKPQPAISESVKVKIKGVQATIRLSFISLREAVAFAEVSEENIYIGKEIKKFKQA